MLNINEDTTVSLIKSNYSEELFELVRSNIPAEELRTHLEDYHENDIAEIFGELTKAERMKLYEILDIQVLSNIFSYLEDVEIYISELENPKAADIIEEMDADDAVEALESLTDEKKLSILKLLAPEIKEDVCLIESFSDEMIGSRMTTNYISVKKTETIKEVMRSLVKQAADNDNVQKIFVTDSKNVFYGTIDLRDLIIARGTQPLDDIITTKYPFFIATAPIEDCIQELETYSEDAVPILDEGLHLIGVITASDVAEVVHEEIAEDYAKFAGLTEADDLKESLLKSLQKRIPWLLILLSLGLVVSGIIQAFQAFIPPTLIIIYTFQSLILGMSGNAGTQSLAVTIRVLSDNNLKGKEKLKFVLKELRIGVCNGAIVGGLAFVFIGAYIQLFQSSAMDALSVSGFTISACIGISLLVAMTIASLDGTIIPIVLKKVGIDPAVASGPLITTLNDLFAVCAYYGISILLFVKLLG